MQDRTGSTKVIKVPSHVDIEGNERADDMAKEGVKKHGKKMRDEREQKAAEEARERKRQRQEEEGSNTSKWRSTPRKRFSPENPELMPLGKRYKSNSAQVLIDLGPLLGPAAVTLPRMRAVTYLDLHSQLTAEQVRAKMMNTEEQIRCAIQSAYYVHTLDYAARFERLQRWVLLVEDRSCRLALGARNQLLRAELHYRAGIVGYEGLAWPHLTQHLFVLTEKYHRDHILGPAAEEWISMERKIANTIAFVNTMAGFVRKLQAADRRERRERKYAVHQFLLEAHFMEQKSLSQQQAAWLHSTWVWHLEWREWIGRGAIVGGTRREGQHILLRARELR